MTDFVGNCGNCRKPLAAQTILCPGCGSAINPESMAEAMRSVRQTIAVEPRKKIQQEESDVTTTRDAGARRPDAPAEGAAEPTAGAPANAPPILPAIYSTGAGPFMQVHGDKGPYIGERRVADIIKSDIERALDAEAEGDPEPVQRLVPRPDPVATEWEEPDPPGQQHYITTICEGAPDDGTGRCPKCHLAIGFDNDYDGSVEGVLRREIKGLRQQARQEEEAAMHSGGILSDVCDIAFDDEGRAMTEGYDGIRERVRELVELERRLMESAEGDGR